ncbi:MAG: hypothetical protein AB9842_10845 [Bacteroidales bacterium]
MRKISSRIRRYYKILIICLLSTNLRAQQAVDYREVFGEKYQDALSFLSAEKWIYDSLTAKGVDAGIAVAVVFPEILRYSAIRDWAETKGLEVLYTQYGDKYADFSIGRFQMKPSFALRIEKDWNAILQKSGNAAEKIPSFDTADNITNRYQRLKRLNELQWQLNYLGLFMLIMDKKYSTVSWKSAEEKLSFYATAYNTGFWKAKEQILKAAARNDFHTSLVKPEVCYNYADIAVDYYRRRAKTLKGPPARQQ